MRRIIVLAAALGLLAAAPLALSATPTPAKATHQWFAGSVSAVGSNSLTVSVLWNGKSSTQTIGQSAALAVTSATKITAGKKHTPSDLASIHVGDLVGVTATASSSAPTALTAVRIHVSCNCHWLGGTIVSVGSTSLVVHAVKSGPFDTVLKGHDVTLQLTGSTTYIRGKARKTISLTDLKVGNRVGVVFAASGFFKAPGFDPSTATFTAKRVHDWGTKKPVPDPSTDATDAATTNS